MPGRRAVRYSRKELLDALSKQCPEALDALPPAESFDFRTLDDENNTVILRVGSKSSRELWVSMEGDCKPWLNYSHYDGASSLKPTWKYCPKGAQFNDPFASLEPNCDSMKALVLFLHVLCGYRDEFPDFDYGRGLPILVRALVCLPVLKPGQMLADDESVALPVVECQPKRKAAKVEKVKKEKTKTITLTEQQCQCLEDVFQQLLD